MTHFGRCLCGRSTYQFVGDPTVSIECHCADCRKVTGSGHASQVGVPVADARLNGPIKRFESTSAKGNALVFGFCGECGSPMFKSTAMAPQTIFFYAGTLDDPTLYRDPIRVFADHRLSWDGAA